jgi:hypothetical protein
MLPTISVIPFDYITWNGKKGAVYLLGKPTKENEAMMHKRTTRKEVKEEPKARKKRPADVPLEATHLPLFSSQQ